MNEAKPEEHAAFNDMLAKGEQGWQEGMAKLNKILGRPEDAPPLTAEEIVPSVSKEGRVRITKRMRREARINELRDGLKDD